jgi:hypothetical protein
MTKMIPITPERFGTLRWRRPTSMAFAATTPAAVLVAAELPQAMLAFPLVFLPVGDGFLPAALLGLHPQQSLMVGPDGRWQARYVPAALRVHPFAFVQSPDGQQRVLCIDEDSGLLTDGPEGEPFFEPDGQQPSKALREVLDMLQQMDAGRALLHKSCAELKAQNLIQPWNLRWRTSDGEHGTPGLYRIDEAALQKVPDEDFLKLRHSGALPLAYSQLLSMHNAESLVRFAQARAQAAPKPTTTGQDDLAFLSKEGVLRF